MVLFLQILVTLVRWGGGAVLQQAPGGTCEDLQTQRSHQWGPL